MKTKQVQVLFLLLAVFTVSLTSCQKFAEGGRISKAESNLKVSWKLEKYLRNSNDETGSLLIQNYVEVYSDNKVLLRSYTKNGQVIAENGSWELNKEEENLHISGVGSVEMTSASGSVSSSLINVIKLDKDEFWYFYMNGGDRHEFHLVKN